jgi:hypothetical protein
LAIEVPQLTALSHPFAWRKDVPKNGFHISTQVFCYFIPTWNASLARGLKRAIKAIKFEMTVIAIKRINPA